MSIVAYIQLRGATMENLKKQLHEIANSLYIAKGNLEIALDQLDIEHPMYERFLRSLVQLKVTSKRVSDTRDLLRSEEMKNIKPSTITVKDIQGLITTANSGCALDIEYENMDICTSASINLKGSFNVGGLLILRNIFSNALKAQATKLKISIIEESKVISLNIEDNGEGITEQDLKSLGFGSTCQGVKDIRDLVYDLGGVVEWQSYGKDKGTMVSLTFEREKTH